MPRIAPTVLLLAALVVPWTSRAHLEAQNVTVDEGTFTLFVDDQEVGSEEFSIRRLGGGSEARILANAVVEMDTGGERTRMRPVLEAEADGDAVSYQNKVGGADETEVGIQAADRRFVARIRSAEGERERELRRAPDVVLLEGTVAHQYHFIARQATSGATIPVIVPRTGEQHEARVTEVAEASVRIDGTTRSARKVTLAVDGEVREVWFDEDDRVLQLAIPSLGFRAVRQSL